MCQTSVIDTWRLEESTLEMEDWCSGSPGNEKNWIGIQFEGFPIHKFASAANERLEIAIWLFCNAPVAMSSLLV